MRQGYSVTEAAQRLDCSEATVRRDVDKGYLEVVADSRPLLLSTTSVDKEVAEKLARMGVELATPQQATEQARRVADLEEQNRLLRGALSDLTAAHSALTDTFRRLSVGAIPNN